MHHKTCDLIFIFVGIIKLCCSFINGTFFWKKMYLFFEIKKGITTDDLNIIESAGLQKIQEFIFNRPLFHCSQTNESCNWFEIQLIEFTGLGPKCQLIIHLQWMKNSMESLKLHI